MVEEGKTIVLPESQSIITLDENHAAIVVHNVETLTKSFKQWLKEEVDYTRTLFGRSDKPSLLDPGAQKIRSFFQAYPETHILEHLEDTTLGSERVKYVVRADITHVSGVRIGSGVGSCTTDESKYKYRWLTADKLRDMGYTEAQIGELLKREMSARRGGHFTVYRIRNPEILDLDNTILKMASKRAEVDATLSLPGVSGVFTQDIDQYPDAPADEPPRKPVETEAKPVFTKKIDTEEAEQIKKEYLKGSPASPQPQAAKPSMGNMKLNPKAGEAEEAVKAALEANGLTTQGFLITVYGNRIYVQPPEDLAQDEWNNYNKVLGYIQSKWSQEGHRWEVPRP